jgi:hypothetical protein
MTDLSKVVPSGSTLIPFFAEYINPRGEIVASAIALTNGNFHAFCRPLAITEQMP